MEVQQKPFAVLKMELEQGYKLIEAHEIQEFLEEHPYLERPLLEIPHKLKEYFSDVYDIQLCLVRDYEYRPGTGFLVLARTHQEMEQKLDTLDCFNVEWFDKNYRDISHLIVISVV